MPSVMMNNLSMPLNSSNPWNNDYQLREPSKGFTILMMIIQITVIIVALLGNILVCTAILVHERLRTTVTNYFIFSLAVSDIITASIAMPMDIDQHFKEFIWTHGEVVCNIWAATYLIAAPLSILNLLAVSVDRYNAIIDPLHYTTIMTPKVVFVTIISLWTYSLLFTVIAMAGWPIYPSSVVGEVCHFNIQPNYSLVSSMINFVLPTIVMCVLYFRIYKVAHAHARRIGRHEYSHTVVYNSETNTVSQERRSMSRNIKATKTIAILVSAFLFCWMPHTLMSCTSILGGEKFYYSTPPEVIIVTLTLAYTNSALNPFLYAFHNKDFRESFRRLMKLQFQYI